RRNESTNMVHSQINNQSAVGTSFDGRDIELARWKQIVEQIVAWPVLILCKIDDLVRIEIGAGQRRLSNAVRNTVSKVGAKIGSSAAFPRVWPEPVLGDIMLSHCDLLHVVGHCA